MMVNMLITWYFLCQRCHNTKFCKAYYFLTIYSLIQTNKMYLTLPYRIYTEQEMKTLAKMSHCWTLNPLQTMAISLADSLDFMERIEPSVSHTQRLLPGYSGWCLNVWCSRLKYIIVPNILNTGDVMRP